jgi:hypothetical protein
VQSASVGMSRLAAEIDESQSEMSAWVGTRNVRRDQP